MIAFPRHFPEMQIAGMKNLCKQILGLSGCSMLLFFASCTKDNATQLSVKPSFTAKVNGTVTRFTNTVTARSVKNSSGNFELQIEGRENIGVDSNIVIRFVIPDFTLNGQTSADHPLNTQFNGNFIEWKTTTNSAKGTYRFFQNGQLSVQQDTGSRLRGNFSFTCFIFDQLGNKTGEVTISEGSFSDVVIER